MENKPFDMKKLDAFKKWLVERGAELIVTTLEYEVLRFRTNRPGVSIVSVNKKGIFKFVGECEEAWIAFCSQMSWTAGTVVVKRRKHHSHLLYKTLIERDGDLCFYCGLPLNRDFVSIEHLLPVTHGGSNHISNLVLTHKCCNNRVGNLSVSEKVRYREQQYQQRGLYNVK